MTNRYLKAALFFGFALFSADANVPFPAASTANTLVASVDWLFKDYESLFKSLGVDPKPVGRNLKRPTFRIHLAGAPGWTCELKTTSRKIGYCSWTADSPPADLSEAAKLYRSLVEAFIAKGFKEALRTARASEEVIFGNTMDHPGDGVLIQTALVANRKLVEVSLMVPYQTKVPPVGETASIQLKVDVSVDILAHAR